jgi:hypothetical protein
MTASATTGSNMALNLAPFGRWTLRDKAAQRRLALLQGLPTFVKQKSRVVNREAIDHET